MLRLVWFPVIYIYANFPSFLLIFMIWYERYYIPSCCEQKASVYCVNHRHRHGSSSPSVRLRANTTNEQLDLHFTQYKRTRIWGHRSISHRTVRRYTTHTGTAQRLRPNKKQNIEIKMRREEHKSGFVFIKHFRFYFSDPGFDVANRKLRDADRPTTMSRSFLNGLRVY